MNYITTHQKPPLSFPSVSGAVCSFDSQYAGLPLKSHTVAVTGYQSGSGTPSPSNPRALNGWSAITITANSVPTVISIGSTIYGGNYDAISGVLTKTHDLMSGSYFINPQNNNDGTGTVCFILASNTPFKPPVNYCMCNILQSSNENWNALPANSYSISNNTYIVVCSDTPNQTRSQFIDWFDNNVQMCLELQSSTTIQLPPVRVETLEGVVNNIWADTGDTTLQYIKLG